MPSSQVNANTLWINAPTFQVEVSTRPSQPQLNRSGRPRLHPAPQHAANSRYMPH
jgi:hypothetical protein